VKKLAALDLLERKSYVSNRYNRKSNANNKIFFTICFATFYGGKFWLKHYFYMSLPLAQFSLCTNHLN